VNARRTNTESGDKHALDRRLDASVLNLENRFRRVPARSMSLHDRQRLESKPLCTVIFADLHETATALAPLREFASIDTVVLVHPSRRILVRRINMLMRLNIGSILPATFNYPPMPDALDLTCQTQFDGLAPEKCGVTRISRPVGAARCW
jgi:hypothetical protein